MKYRSSGSLPRHTEYISIRLLLDTSKYKTNSLTSPESKCSFDIMRHVRNKMKENDK